MMIKMKELMDSYNLKIDGILHIGAHQAEELDDYLALGFEKIIWVEANPDLYEGLLRKTIRYKENRVIICAAHDVDGLDLEMNVTNNGQSSSLLEMGTHATAHPHVWNVGKTKVKTQRMETLLSESSISPGVYNFVNIDIQGTELLALRGFGDRYLAGIDYVYTEINEEELYKGCCLEADLSNFLSEKGFEQVAKRMTNHGWGDAFYMRTKR